MTNTPLAALAALAALALPCAVRAEPPDAPGPARRVALAIGANDGGPGREPLRFADDDARAFARVLTELGGVAPPDVRVVLEPTPRALLEAIGGLGRAARAARPGARRVEVFVYYSGHSDERGLLLGAERLGYGALRTALATLDAEVRVVVLDSCSSGSFTRRKGGRRVAGFLSDESVEVRGQAVLTSTARDEAAQESDQLGASFFTHFLVSGMRGAADDEADGRVTLNEAYRFAFRETLRRTERTLAGAQHPAFDIQMAGHGDLVLTEPSRGAASLTLSADVAGRIYIRNARGALVVETQKQAGAPMTLGLAPDDYEITVAAGARRAGAAVSLARGTSRALTRATLRAIDAESTRARGAKASEEAEDRVAFGLDLLPYLGLSSWRPRARRGVSINIVGGISGGADRFEFGGALNIAHGPPRGVQWAGALNVDLGGLDGGAIAGGANIIVRDARGWALAGATNVIAGDLDGAAVTGGANIVTGGVRGAMVAPINIAAGDVSGAQIGVINLARTSSASIGLVNIIWRGSTEAEVGADTGGFARAGILHGSRSWYSIYALAYRPAAVLGATLGLGWRPALAPRLFANLDALYTYIADAGEDRPFGGNSESLAQARARLGWRLSDRFSVVGGPSLDVFVGDQCAGQCFGYEATEDTQGVRVFVRPGASAGVQWR